jgi:hypothetical protein
MRRFRRPPKNSSSTTLQRTMADITAMGQPPSRPTPTSRASRRAARKQQAKNLTGIVPNMMNLSRDGLPIQNQPAQSASRASTASIVRKALNASKVVQAPTGVQNTPKAGQMIRQGGRLIGKGMRQGVIDATRGTVSAASSASRGVAEAGRQVNVQISKTVARRFENRPMTTMGGIVRLFCFILFWTLTVRFLWVGVPPTLWIMLVLWGLLMFVYFYNRMDLCAKPV